MCILQLLTENNNSVVAVVLIISIIIVIYTQGVIFLFVYCVRLLLLTYHALTKYYINYNNFIVCIPLPLSACPGGGRRRGWASYQIFKKSMGGVGEGLTGSQFLEGDCRGRRWVTFNRLNLKYLMTKKFVFLCHN